MKFTKEIVDAINIFIIENIPAHQNDILPTVMNHFGLSKPTASKYLNALIQEGIIARESKGRYPRYHLKNTVVECSYPIDKGLDEDAIWRHDFSVHLADLSYNVRQLCQYGFTEMVNNAIEHSESEKLEISLVTNALELRFEIRDYGVGIFIKIQKDLGLEDPKHSILELTKGKFTSDPRRHSGEGIFFTSRIFDYFTIHSGDLSFSGYKDNDWLFEGINHIDGTLVVLKIKKNTTLNVADVFNEYSDPDKSPSFHKTIIPVQLMQYEGESLMSRSQARRLITRFDRFLEVVLDFTGVEMIGQGFADEVFRVFTEAHPSTRLVPVNYNNNVKNMILHVGGVL